jgi:hypothetical protein
MCPSLICIGDFKIYISTSAYYIYHKTLVNSLYNEITSVYYICKSIGAYIILCNVSSCNGNDNNNDNRDNIVEVSNIFVVIMHLCVITSFATIEALMILLVWSLSYL